MEGEEDATYYSPHTKTFVLNINPSVKQEQFGGVRGWGWVGGF